MAPDYVVYAGLVFMRLEAELLKTLGRGWPQSANRDLVWHQLFREAERPEEADREVIVLTRVLRHAVNSQMALNLPVGGGRDQRPSHPLARRRGRGLRLEPRALPPARPSSGDGGIEALDRERAEAAHPEILRQYAIPHDRKL